MAVVFLLFLTGIFKLTNGIDIGGNCHTQAKVQEDNANKF